MIANEELSRKLEPFVLPAIVVLVGLSAFGLGRLSVRSAEEPPRLVIQEASAQTATAEARGSFVASATGTKYYLSSCAGAARIKEENRIYFASAQEAQAAGYEPAANCPGL